MTKSSALVFRSLLACMLVWAQLAAAKPADVQVACLKLPDEMTAGCNGFTLAKGGVANLTAAIEVAADFTQLEAHLSALPGTSVRVQFGYLQQQSGGKLAWKRAGGAKKSVAGADGAIDAVQRASSSKGWRSVLAAQALVTCLSPAGCDIKSGSTLAMAAADGSNGAGQLGSLAATAADELDALPRCPAAGGTGGAAECVACFDAATGARVDRLPSAPDTVCEHRSIDDAPDDDTPSSRAADAAAAAGASPWGPANRAIATEIAKIGSIAHDPACQAGLADWSCGACQGERAPALNASTVRVFETTAVDGCTNDLCGLTLEAAQDVMNFPYDKLVGTCLKSAGLAKGGLIGCTDGKYVTGDTAYVAKSATLNAVLVVFRATYQGLTNGQWASNCRAVEPRLDAATGVFTEWICPKNALQAKVVDYLAQWYASDPTLPQTVIVGGHSRGGMLATLIAPEVQKALPAATVHLYALSAPRAGGKLPVDAARAVKGDKFLGMTRFDGTPRGPDNVLLPSSVALTPLVWQMQQGKKASNPFDDKSDKLACYTRAANKPYVAAKWPAGTVDCSNVQVCKKTGPGASGWCAKWARQLLTSLLRYDYVRVDHQFVFDVDMEGPGECRPNTFPPTDLP